MMDAQLAEKINTARNANYTDDQIIQHLRKSDPRVETASKAGYNSKEIIDHLLSGPTEVEAGGKKFKFDTPQDAAGFQRSVTGSAIPPEQLAPQYAGTPMAAEPLPAARKPAPTGLFGRAAEREQEAQGLPPVFGRLGRSVAGLADTTLGGVVPGAIQQLGYPLARAWGGQTPEAATALVGKLSAPFEKPFGRAFGVTETPEYKGEASQQLTQFIGENVGKGAKWLAEKTGLPEQDITNMIGTAGIAAAPALGKVPKALGERQAARAIEASNQTWENLPRMEAAQAANKHGILLNPAESNPSKRNDLRVAMAGGKNVSDYLAEKNAPRWTQLAKEEMGLPKNTVLEPAAFDKARAALSKPYDRIQSIGRIGADPEFFAALDNLGAAETIGGAPSDAVARLAAQAKQRALAPIDGGLILQSIKQRRHSAQQIYKRENSASPPSAAELAEADANMRLANALEDLAARNIYDPKFKAELQAARAEMAKTYAYERATNFATGRVDPNVIAKLVNADPDRYTGTIKEIGQIAGNFPDIANVGQPRSTGLPKLARGSPSAIGGGLLGAALMSGGGLPGVAMGGLAGFLGGKASRAGIATPGFQARRAVPFDNRLRVPTPEEVPPIPPAPNLPVVYDWSNALLGSETYNPNWVFGRNDVGGMPPRPEFNPPPPAGPQLTYDLTDLSAKQRRAYELARDRAADVPPSPSPTVPTTGGVELSFDPFINKLRPVQPAGTTLPPTNELASAVGKIERGERVTLSATEKIAWDKAQADLVVVDPAFRSLSPSDLVNRMADRKWVEDTARKAREKAAAFDEIARRAKDRQAVNLANANRERMMDLAEELDDRLRVMPTVKLNQGPKTRAAKSLPPVVVKATRLPPEE